MAAGRNLVESYSLNVTPPSVEANTYELPVCNTRFNEPSAPLGSGGTGPEFPGVPNGVYVENSMGRSSLGPVGAVSVGGLWLIGSPGRCGMSGRKTRGKRTPSAYRCRGFGKGFGLPLESAFFFDEIFSSTRHTSPE